MRIGFRRAALVAIFVGQAGCHSLTQTDDLTAGNGRDAGDAASQATSRDDAGDAGKNGGCATLSPAPTFCDDFDDAWPLEQKWPTVVRNAGGRVVVDGTTFHGSAPSSLVTSAEASASGAALEYVERDFDVSTSLEVSFDARVDALGAGDQQGTLLSIYTADGPAGVARTILYYMKATGGELEEERTPPFANWSRALAAPPPIGAWVHYDLTLTLGAEGAATVDWSVDGATIFAHAALGQAWRPGTFKLAIGLSWLNASQSAWGTHYDNVVVRAR